MDSVPDREFVPRGHIAIPTPCVWGEDGQTPKEEEEKGLLDSKKAVKKLTMGTDLRRVLERLCGQFMPFLRH